jgi:tetratricopeptide (TPR) repeat protein
VKRSQEYDTDCHAYGLITGSASAALDGAGLLIKAGELSQAKLLIESAISGANVKSVRISGSPDHDIASCIERFNQTRLRALIFGKAGSLMEEVDDRAAITFFDQSISSWDMAWRDADKFCTEWDLSVDEICDEDSDCDYTFSYALRIAQAYERLSEWNHVVTSVERSVRLSGPISYQEHDLLSTAYEELGDYDSCMKHLAKMRKHWYDEDDADRELEQICVIAAVAERNGRFHDAIDAYDLFSEYYWRFENVAGRIEFNKACLWLRRRDLGEAFVVLHNARRFFVSEKCHSNDDLFRCDQAISCVQSAISLGSEVLPDIEPFNFEEICL